MASARLADRIREVASAAGLDAVGFTRAEVFDGTRQDLLRRKQAGFAGGIAFTYRNPERSTDPERLLPGARSLVVAAMTCGGGDVQPPQEREQASVARFAREDRYRRLRDALEKLAMCLRAEGFRSKVVADDNALVDREAAVRAGIGYYGKNTMVLLPRRGSMFLLGSVVTDAELPASPRYDGPGCGRCTRCMSSCPTNAIVAPGVLDARRCLAWLLQSEGDIPVQYRELVGARIYGCDDCQEVCPPNRLSLRKDSVRRQISNGAGSSEAVPGGKVDLVAVVTSSDDELIGRFGHFYIPRRQPRYLRRNALVALGNCADRSDPRVLSALRHAIESGDEMLASHARWAAEKLDLAEQLSLQGAS